MQKPVNKGTELWEMFGAFFKLYSKYGIPENKSEYWKPLMDEAVKFGEDFKKCSDGLSIKLAFAILEHLYEKEKANRVQQEEM